MMFLAIALHVAVASTAAFQCHPSSARRGPSVLIPALVPRDRSRPRGRARLHASGSGAPRAASTEPAATPVRATSTTEPATTPSITSLLEEGKINDAVAALRRSGAAAPAAVHHAVLEACARGGAKPRGRGFSARKDRMETAAELLRAMEGEGGATAYAHEVVVAGYARRGRWRDARAALARMEEAGGPDAPPPPHVYQAVMVALAQAHQFDRMNAVLVGMRRRGVSPSAETYNALLKVCASDRLPRWKEALKLVSQCQREPGITPDVVTYTTSMKACARGGQEEKVWSLFRAAKDLGTLELDVYFYTTAMDACAKGKKRNSCQIVLALLEEMKNRGIEPNEVTFSVAVTACGNAGRWRRALEFLDEMRSLGLKINTITYNSAIAALSKASRAAAKQHGTGDRSDADELWQETQKLLTCMENDGIRRDSFTYSAAMGTCGVAERWQEAVRLIETMKGNGIKPNMQVYTSAITACAKSRQWDPALALFNDMKKKGRPDVISYNALVGAGMAAEKTEEVLGLWSEMCQPSNTGVKPDIVTLTEVIATLDGAGGANRKAIDKVFAEAVLLGLLLREDSLDTRWEVDLSRMSRPVARAACRFVFRRFTERAAKDEEEAMQDLSLITGAGRMREYVREVLRDELRPSVYCVVLESEQGTLVVREQMMKNYIKGQTSQ